MSRRNLALGLFMVVAAAGAAGAQGRGNAAIRFKEMDRNGDNVISRAEWRGSNRSFEVHDWNGDGRLAGDEVRVGGARKRAKEPVFDSADREYVYDDWTDRGFRSLDHNKDARITADEWHFDRESYRRADHNRDGILSRAEFLNEAPGEDEDDDRDDRFLDLDADGDGRISRSEWHGGAIRFNVLDDNRDGFLSRTEMLGNEPPPDLFTSVDVNRDRLITRDEWHWSGATFNQRDRNRDGRLTPQEFGDSTPAVNQTAAYRTGYERGTIEGRSAGREERLNNRAWDLEGQSELDSADSGYQPGMGPKAEYQAGYRAGFRRAYREGWDQAK